MISPKKKCKLWLQENNTKVQEKGNKGNKNKYKHNSRQLCFNNSLEERIWEHLQSKKLKTCRWLLRCNKERLIVLNKNKHTERQPTSEDTVKTRGTKRNNNMVYKAYKCITVTNYNNHNKEDRCEMKA